MSNIVYFLAQAAGNPNALLTTVLLPFILIFVILWGILNVMKMFGKEETGRKINIVVAMIITIFAAFTDAWGIVATQLAAFTGQFVFVLFIAVFIIGAIMWAIGRGRGIYGEHLSAYNKVNFNNLKDIDKQLAKIHKKLLEADARGDVSKVEVLSKTYGELEERKKAFLKKIELKHSTYY